MECNAGVGVQANWWGSARVGEGEGKIDLTPRAQYGLLCYLILVLIADNIHSLDSCPVLSALLSRSTKQ